VYGIVRRKKGISVDAPKNPGKCKISFGGPDGFFQELHNSRHHDTRGSIERYVQHIETKDRRGGPIENQMSKNIRRNYSLLIFEVYGIVPRKKEISVDAPKTQKSANISSRETILFLGS